MVQIYYMVNITTNIVDNIVNWDGDVNSWASPSGYLMLPKSTTPTKVWMLNSEETEMVLTESIETGDIGFTWDGTYLITNRPVPPLPPAGFPQPVVENLPSV